jgi:peptidoglycan/LPS O-acetylase OafA/YrhL
MPFAFEGSDTGDEKTESTTYRYRFNKLDRRVGELAYPFYTSHLAILVLMYAIVPDLTADLGALWSSVIILILSVALAILLLKFIQDPIDRYRRGHVSSSSTISRAERRRRNKPLTS